MATFFSNIVFQAELSSKYFSALIKPFFQGHYISFLLYILVVVVYSLCVAVLLIFNKKNKYHLSIATF